MSTTVPRAAGCFHPLQALPGFDVPATHLEGVVAGIDGDAAAIEGATNIAERLGMRPVQLTVDGKDLYHAAAVTVAGHATALFSQAMSMMARAGFTPAEARDALLPLMRGAVDNLSGGLPAEVITGPVSRGDAGTVMAHLARLDAEQPAAAISYRALAAEALDLVRSELPPADVAALDEALAS